jgi:hypothetical protein
MHLPDEGTDQKPYYAQMLLYILNVEGDKMSAVFMVSGLRPTWSGNLLHAFQVPSCRLHTTTSKLST